MSLCWFFMASLTTSHGADNAVAMGHINLIVKDIDKNRDFWLALGGTAGKKNNIDFVKFPGVVVFLNEGVPNGPSVGTVINHFGLQFPDLEKTVANIRDMGLPIITQEAVGGNPILTVGDNGVATVTATGDRLGFTVAPNGTRVELYENKALTVPVKSHHIHFNNPEVDAMKAWYVETLGAAPGQRTGMEAADVVDINLTFSPANEPQAATRGRALDLIGFEVRSLKTLYDKLVQSGVKFDTPYRIDPKFGFATATLTDPWGTAIMLTEGLATY